MIDQAKIQGGQFLLMTIDGQQRHARVVRRDGTNAMLEEADPARIDNRWSAPIAWLTAHATATTWRGEQPAPFTDGQPVHIIQRGKAGSGHVIRFERVKNIRSIPELTAIVAASVPAMTADLLRARGAVALLLIRMDPNPPGQILLALETAAATFIDFDRRPLIISHLVTP